MPLSGKQKSHIFKQRLVVNAIPSHFLALGIFAFALIVKLAVLANYAHSPFFHGLLWDSDNYFSWAKRIMAGDLIGIKIFHQPPLYPYFLALVMKIAGVHITAIYVCQIIIGAFSVVLIFLIGKQCHGELAGIVSSAFAIACGLLAFYDLKILSESLSILIELITAWLLLKNSTLWRILAGFSLGLLIICKPQFLMLIPCIVWLIFRTDGGKKIFKSILFTLSASIIILPVTIRNYFVEHDIVLVSSNGGENFYIGNHQGADGLYNHMPGVSQDIIYQDEDIRTAAQKAAGKTLNRSEVSGYWFHKALHEIREDPLKYFGLQMSKIRFLLSGIEHSSMYYMSFEQKHFSHWLRFLFVNFYLLFPLFAAGFVSSWKRKSCFLIVYAFIVINIANILIFFYDTRFMLLALPFCILFSGIGGIEIAHAYANRNIKGSWRSPLSISFLIGVCFSIGIYFCERKTEAPQGAMYGALGEIYYQNNQFDSALKAFTMASSIDKNDWVFAFDVAKVAFKKGYKKIGADLYRDAFPNINSDFRRDILRDQDLDSLRNYIEMEDNSTTKDSSSLQSFPVGFNKPHP